MKFFWVLFLLWMLALFLGDSDTETHAHIRDATLLLLMFIGLAVYAITKHIDRARRQIQEPDFDLSAENRKEWMEVAQIGLLVAAVLVVGTIAQGTFRCLSSGEDFSLSCVGKGTAQQIADDLN